MGEPPSIGRLASDSSAALGVPTAPELTRGSSMSDHGGDHVGAKLRSEKTKRKQGSLCCNDSAKDLCGEKERAPRQTRHRCAHGKHDMQCASRMDAAAAARQATAPSRRELGWTTGMVQDSCDEMLCRVMLRESSRWGAYI